MLYNEVQLNVELELEGNARYKCHPQSRRSTGRCGMIQVTGPAPGVQNLNAVGDSDPRTGTRLRVVNLLSSSILRTGAHHYYDSALSSAVSWSPQTIAVSHTLPYGINNID